MAKKLMSWKTKGMNRDLSVSAFNPEFAFENRNLRLSTNDANTTMSWVNEKGTLPIGLKNVEYWSRPIINTVYSRIVYEDPKDSTWVYHAANTETMQIIGTPIGTAVINHQLVVFSTDTLTDKGYGYDYIYVLKYLDEEKTSMSCKILFGGENQTLGFDVEHPIETLVSYESETVQKVYWTDGLNQPRVINIVGKRRFDNTAQFDFVPTLQLQEKVEVTKLLGANGMFAPGVIQYALTYFTKNGQESNIFYVSPLQYISYRDRGASPEDKVENAFRITVKRVDSNFDYLRIYSIQRTSIDATPVCKRIQDVSIEGLTESGDDGLKLSYIDTGMSGDTIDPTELLYKGGEVISANTLEQKDNTLFLGNITIKRPQIGSTLKESLKSTSIAQSTRKIVATSVSTGSYVYANQLTSKTEDGLKTVPCAGFKYGDVYRLGMQFQDSTGKWSEPVWIKDQIVENKPSLNYDNTVITLPVLNGTISAGNVNSLVSLGYRRVRPLVVFPKMQDRNILCQGVVNPTLFTQEHRNNEDLKAQSSWFFRASGGKKINSGLGTGQPASGTGKLPYTHRGVGPGVPSGCTNYNPKNASDNPLRLVEVQGDYNDNNKYQIARDFVTFHSPDIEFDDQLSLTDYSSTKFRQIGFVQFSGTMSDIDIQTESPAISSLGGGFIHKSFRDSGAYGIVSGLFYDDCLVDDNDDRIEAYTYQKCSCKFMVYLWNKTGSLNNDVNRPANKGTQTAKLKKKVISNLRYANTTFGNASEGTFSVFPHIFDSDQSTIIKLQNEIYMGNIDTSIVPDNSDGNYFAFNNAEIRDIESANPTFSSDSYWWKTFSEKPTEMANNGVYRYGTSAWEHVTDDFGDGYLDLVIKKDPVRIKYKSTAHLVFKPYGNINWMDNETSKLPVLEITQTVSDETRFGGKSSDAFKENVWLPCGEPVLLTDNSSVSFSWEYGDTYFQRWDCLKTYPFAPEDINQVVEIGSFMLETRTNIDGRYDRNRGQMNNLNMTPQNFNLLNPIYSQKDNFFQYRIQDEDFYQNTKYPNQITWSKTKNSDAEIDLWTNVTLASVLELDGNKGEVTSLQRLNNQLICFQNSGISQILYNDNVQVQSTQGVPIEIANSGKVQGKDYKSDTVGCSNKWSIVSGEAGLYFMDSDGKNIYLFNGQLHNISVAGGFNAWSKMYIPSSSTEWNPTFPVVNDQSAFVSYYDRINQEVLFINKKVCLAFSEKFNIFTSFYDYDRTPYFCSLDDTGIWLRSSSLWKHQSGEYCKFFGGIRPYSMVLVGNPEPQTDKIFTNMEFRACVDGDGELDKETGKFTPALPFDSLDTWNEYQHGMAFLSNKSGHDVMMHHTKDNEASLKRRFRIWRCDIPRDNGDNLDTFDETFDETFHPLARAKKYPLDRMRNPWLYLRLRKDDNENGGSSKRVEIHDIVMTYYN